VRWRENPLYRSRPARLREMGQRDEPAPAGTRPPSIGVRGFRVFVTLLAVAIVAVELVRGRYLVGAVVGVLWLVGLAGQLMLRGEER
jgi:hypothetical protein